MVRVFLIVCCFLAGSFVAHAKERVLVFAAASLTDVMTTLAAEYEKTANSDVVISFAGTGQLARQIEAGAPADLIITAHNDWMAWLSKRSLVDDSQIINIAGNRLVVAVRRETENWVDVSALLTNSRFAMAEPDTVPAGFYARQALQGLGLWEKARKNAVYGENVRLALRRLELGGVEAAIVYASDLNIAPNAREAFAFKPALHDAIRYQAALVRGEKMSKEAFSFLRFLKSDVAVTVFRAAGFSAVKE